MNLIQFQTALEYRLSNINLDQIGAFRLFNGFLEGEGDWVVDLFGKTLLIYWYGKDTAADLAIVEEFSALYRKKFPQIEAVVLKSRFAKEQDERFGKLLFGEKPDREISEFGVRYGLDLFLNQDASFYLDTRNLRKWLLENVQDKSVLNTFAYTSSLGVAAQAGGAKQVVHTDLNKRFLNLAKSSYTLNGLPINKKDFQPGDFFKKIANYKNEGRSFDCVILDPPFFSSTQAGKVDLLGEYNRLVNKVRPLVNHEGKLVLINNALFLPGKDYMQMLENLMQDGYLSLDKIIPIPKDITGSVETRMRILPVDPAPFNHATKIVILDVRRKQF